jgi:large repetitive protein
MVSADAGQAQVRTVVTGPDGRFALTDLEPQDYLLTLGAPGFQSQTRSVEVSAGQMLDLGLMPLGLEPETALVRGRVTDATTGGGIGAAISVNGSSSAGTTADADGTFVVSVPAGDLHLAVTAAGYRPVEAGLAISAGERLLFSPSLVPEDASDPEPGVTFSGRLVDAQTGAPVPGAVIRIVGSSAMALSDTAGAFSVVYPEAGEIRIEVLHASYQPAIVHLLTTPGAPVELGDLYLFPNPETTSTLLGLVVDRETGAPVGGAQVQADGRLTHTDAAGHFRIDGIDALEFDVSVGAIGYHTTSGRLVLEQPGWVRLDVALEPVAADGIRVTDWSGTRRNTAPSRRRGSARWSRTKAIRTEA